MDTFGDLSGIVFNETTQNLIGGHQRRLIIPDDAELVITDVYNPLTEKKTTAEGYVLYKGERFKYRQVRFSEIEESQANLVANKGGGEWDYSMLPDIFLDLDHHNADMTLTGFEEMEIKNLIDPWSSDIEALDKIEENLDGITATIKITCPQELKDEVLIFIKSKLLETSFEGVNVS
jgi:hypothetical protein